MGICIRNLLYHIWPVKGRGVWQWNVAQLLRRIDQFAGQRVVAVVTDDQSDSFEAVKAAFKGTVTNFLHFQNDPTLGETATFAEMLKRVENIDQRQITFYGHAKGVKYQAGSQPTVRRWTRTMYSNLLDYPSLVDDSLNAHPIVGTFKKHGNAFGKLEPSWHYAGTFFWFRNSEIFSAPGWHRVPAAWWGTEAWPGSGIGIPSNKADTLFVEGNAQEMQLYSPGTWAQRYDPQWKDWQIKHAALHRYGSYSEINNALTSRRIIVSGPQRSGTMIAGQILAHDRGLPFISEEDFDTHDFQKFRALLRSRKEFVIQAPSISPYLHQCECCDIIWMRRNLNDIIRSQKRIGWQQHEQIERDRYFDHSHDPIAVVKTRAWDLFQRIALTEAAWDLDYESLKSHSLWLPKEKRANFAERQTK